MKRRHTACQFAQHDDEIIAVMAGDQRETGYVPTTEELGQLLQCSTHDAARQHLTRLMSSGKGSYLSPEDQQGITVRYVRQPS